MPCRMQPDFLHVLAHQVPKPKRPNFQAANSALATSGASQSLVRLLLWLSESTTAVATVSGVLEEAQQHSGSLMVVGEGMRQVLAVEGGLHNKTRE